MGDNVFLGDRNGVRTPMQWSADRNAGFSRANPQRLILPDHHRPRVPLRGDQRRGAAEQPQLAALVDEAPHRAAQAVPGVRPRHDRVPDADQPARAGLRAPATSDETILVVANLSRFVQYVELDLGEVEGDAARRAVRPHRVPADRRAALPAHARRARLLLVLARAAPVDDGRRCWPPPTSRPRIACASAESLLVGEDRVALEDALPAFLDTRRWFAGARLSHDAPSRIEEAVALGGRVPAHRARRVRRPRARART